MKDVMGEMGYEKKGREEEVLNVVGDKWKLKDGECVVRREKEECCK